LAPGDPPQHRFAGEARKHRHAQPGQRRERPKQRDVVIVSLAEAETRIDHDALARNARGERCIDAAREVLTNFRDDVAVAGINLHRLRIALLVHEADGR
jgi:hypothetical protein